MPASITAGPAPSVAYTRGTRGVVLNMHTLVRTGCDNHFHDVYVYIKYHVYIYIYIYIYIILYDIIYIYLLIILLFFGFQIFS